ncbi:MAG: peptide ABC transporter substrate-binding protein [Flavobacteriales bacterium]|nr:MAG: peptide ABC transporter substrate-binding protein [Flavobacteriales bacterium]
MKKTVFLLSAAALLLWGCPGPTDSGQQVQELPGGKVAGGVFRINEVEDFRNLYPLEITEVTSFRITNQIYEGLVKFNQKDLSIIPSLAESWEVNEDATSFTFKIRKGVKFHEDECFGETKTREVNAHDFKYCLDRLCVATPDNQMFWLFQGKVIGADEYYESTYNDSPLEGGVEGVKVIDDYTIQINLKFPFAGFLNIIAHSACWVYPKEAYEKYGIEMRVTCVGTGAFKVKTVEEGKVVILEKNPNYWGKDKHGNQLPYLDAIKFSFLKEKKSELFEFRKGNLDMVFKLPLEMIDDVLGELEEAKEGGNMPFNIQVTPAMVIQYYGFQHKSALFSNKKLRLAMNYAIDRETIVTYTLQGDGTAATYGIVPIGFKGYEYDSLKGYNFDPEKARKLLAEAGYPNGEGLEPLTLQLNSGGSNNIMIAEVIQSQLKENLNITVKMDVMPFAQHLEKLETGNTLFWRSAWLADYPDPENFLTLLYGKLVPEELSSKSYVNSVRYQNEEYDALFEQALQTVDKAARYRLYRMAEQVMLDDAAIMPIYYDEFTRLLQKNVRNFPANAAEYRDLSEVYFKDEE